jgi:tetratricopeptide (TPR) repeat protein
MSRLLFVLLLGWSVGVWAQSSPSPPNSAPSNAQTPDSGSTLSNKSADTPAPRRAHSLEAPRSDKINADDVDEGESSSKDSQIDLSAPADDTKSHPGNSSMLKDEGSASGNGDVSEFHPWDPHKSAKDVEVGDFYFKRKNYRAAEDRYREALAYKENDAVATFRLAVCLEKLERPDEARKEYENYLKILPHGPEAEGVHKAIERLKGPAASAKSAP